MLEKECFSLTVEAKSMVMPGVSGETNRRIGSKYSPRVEGVVWGIRGRQPIVERA